MNWVTCVRNMSGIMKASSAMYDRVLERVLFVSSISISAGSLSMSMLSCPLSSIAGKGLGLLSYLR